jgi:hypothetical protein
MTADAQVLYKPLKKPKFLRIRHLVRLMIAYEFGDKLLASDTSQILGT